MKKIMVIAMMLAVGDITAAASLEQSKGVFCSQGQSVSSLEEQFDGICLVEKSGEKTPTNASPLEQLSLADKKSKPYQNPEISHLKKRIAALDRCAEGQALSAAQAKDLKTKKERLEDLEKKITTSLDVVLE